jgi:hypothetical protein
MDADLLGMIGLAAVWGITNTFIANATRKQVDTVESSSETHLILRLFLYLVRLIRNWRFTLPFLINQSASVSYIKNW